MILTLLSLQLDLDTIQDQIIINLAFPTFDKVLAQLLHHSSTATQSLKTKSPSDTSMMISQFMTPQSYAQNNSRGGCGCNQGKEQHPHCNIVIEFITPMIVATIYMINLNVLLTWLNLQIPLA